MVTERLDSVSGPDARLFTGPRGGRISTAVLRDAAHEQSKSARHRDDVGEHLPPGSDPARH